jgi:hypothetical protein
LKNFWIPSGLKKNRRYTDAIQVRKTKKVSMGERARDCQEMDS